MLQAWTLTIAAFKGHCAPRSLSLHSPCSVSAVGSLRDRLCRVPANPSAPERRRLPAAGLPAGWVRSGPPHPQTRAPSVSPCRAFRVSARGGTRTRELHTGLLCWSVFQPMFLKCCCPRRAFAKLVPLTTREKHVRGRVRRCCVAAALEVSVAARPTRAPCRDPTPAWVPVGGGAEGVWSARRPWGDVPAGSTPPPPRSWAQEGSPPARGGAGISGAGALPLGTRLSVSCVVVSGFQGAGSVGGARGVLRRAHPPPPGRPHLAAAALPGSRAAATGGHGRAAAALGWASRGRRGPEGRRSRGDGLAVSAAERGAGAAAIPGSGVLAAPAAPSSFTPEGAWPLPSPLRCLLRGRPPLTTDVRRLFHAGLMPRKTERVIVAGPRQPQSDAARIRAMRRTRGSPLRGLMGARTRFCGTCPTRRGDCPRVLPADHSLPRGEARRLLVGTFRGIERCCQRDPWASE